MARQYDALVLDIDGTLVDFEGKLNPRTLETLHRAADSGVRLMVATGRSEPAARPILETLQISEEAVVYNGAGIYCPRRDRLVRERNLEAGLRDRVLDYADEIGYLSVVMCAGRKYAMAPRNHQEHMALHDMHNLQIVPVEELRSPRTIRITLFSDRHETSAIFAEEIENRFEDPLFLTHFSLGILPHHHGSNLLVLDIHPPCRGKAEALEFLEDRHGIPPERVVAVGDGQNDLMMLEAAGLGVCMEEATEEVRAVCDRVIGPCDSDTIAQLVEELFL
jgi:Cof subfamily protein (haloacid dehalogenase superfamily)